MNGTTLAALVVPVVLGVAVAVAFGVMMGLLAEPRVRAWARRWSAEPELQGRCEDCGEHVIVRR